MKPSADFSDFIQLVARLRKECPWDRRQTHESIRDNLIEEAYEAVDAIDQGDMEELKKELGDLLLHIVFHSRMATEEGAFTIDEVIYSISEKLIRRHPHVFGTETVSSDQEVAENWETIKLREGRESVLEGLPRPLPALIRAYRMQEKASGVGFDWSDWELAWKKLEEELEEWRQAVHHEGAEARAEEFGDLLFSMVNVGRLLELDAEASLRQTNSKFERRFRYIEKKLRSRNSSVNEASLEEMDQLWEESKQKA